MSEIIPFNKPPIVGGEIDILTRALNSDVLSGDGFYGKECQSYFEKLLGCEKALLTPSCTAALEMAALLINIQPGDEVIMPSYTFVSTANAFVLRGAKIVFVDVRKDTMNIDETLIEAAITEKTRAIVPVHYAGVSCEMDKIIKIAEKYDLYVIEDAAQAVLSKYKNEYVGVKGHLATYSFHETKNYTSGGEGGLLIINDDRFIEKAEIIREKGTNRSLFFRGQVAKYSWVSVGSSYLPGELQAAHLYAQLQKAERVKERRLEIWEQYYCGITRLEKMGVLELPKIPENCEHNAHMFYIKCEHETARANLIKHLQSLNINAVFHYIPLHSSEAGKEFGEFSGVDTNTTLESDRLVRLPIFYNMTNEQVERVIKGVVSFLGFNY
jgi:dTDP-4-amino-4,6-dideoxygalactose transaminase